MPLRNIQEIEIFDCWGIDFIGPLPSSFSNECILLTVEYVSRLVEAIPSKNSDQIFEEKYFLQVWYSKSGDSDRGSHFCNAELRKAFAHFGVKHRIATAYHPQTNGQAEVSNREVKRILEKTVSTSRRDWAIKLDEALWAYRTAYKTPTAMSPFQLVYGKACHLPVEMEHRVFWALKWLNFDSKAYIEQRRIQLQELEEMRLNAYQSSRLYKERVKAYHDKKLLKRNFEPGELVLLFNSRLKLFPGKLKSRWSGPFVVKQVKPYGAIEIEDAKTQKSWVVNGQRLKHYKGGEVEKLISVITLEE